MGLSEPRRRVKLPSDPNNTQWSSNTTRFGYRMLCSQGWVPGSQLGKSSNGNINHAGLGYKCSTKSAFRINKLRNQGEDTCGLGFNHSNAEDDRAGLIALQSVLNRVNDVLAKVNVTVADTNSRLLSPIPINSNTSTQKSQLASLSSPNQDFLNLIKFVSGGFLKPTINVNAPSEQQSKSPCSLVTRDKSSSTERTNKHPNKHYNDEDSGDIKTKSKRKSSKHKSKKSHRTTKLFFDTDKQESHNKKRKRQCGGHNNLPSSHTLHSAVDKIHSNTKESSSSDIISVPDDIPSSEHSPPHNFNDPFDKHTLARRKNILHKRMAINDTKALNEIFRVSHVG